MLKTHRKFCSRASHSPEQSSMTKIIFIGSSALTPFDGTKFNDENQRFSISLFTTPSAVHLTTCFMSDSQHLRLSVLASLPLSPLQRFNYYIKKDVIPITCMCQEFLCIQQFLLQFTYPSYFLLYSSCLRSNSRFFSMSARYSSLV